MLGDSPIGVVLLAKDLDAAKTFYRDQVGLPVETESDSAVTFTCAGQTKLTVTSSTTGTKDEQTQASWTVTDLESELSELRARGVRIDDIDNDEMTTVDGVYDDGELLHAWFTDPGGNSIGIEQPK